MAKTDLTGVPRVDEAIDLATIRDEAEQIAVPAFDYIAQPIEAVVDGVTGHTHEKDRDSGNTQVDEEF
ncbi:hypothetical protein ABT297_29280 [Dactylosporangium sp. NPDC000555]|uniref:hypothetical protein n=1 Tax=Dactylosporangium sp. NPDC000555 TaxID=3154260 RepID=UPI00331A55E8